jgi:hypothetical protein
MCIDDIFLKTEITYHEASRTYRMSLENENKLRALLVLNNIPFRECSTIRSFHMLNVIVYLVDDLPEEMPVVEWDI